MFQRRKENGNETHSVEVLNGVHATRFPSCLWPYAKLCIFQINRKGTLRTPLCGWETITSRTKWLLSSATRSCKCKIIDYHLKWMQIDTNFWEVRQSRCKRCIHPLIRCAHQTFVFISRSTVEVLRIVFAIICRIQKFSCEILSYLEHQDASF